MNLELHPAAETDVEDAAEFYKREGSPALAARFIQEFKRVSNLLLRNPTFGPPQPRGRRSFSLDAFPYSVIYRQIDDGIKILVVKHDNRRPGFGNSRR